MLKLEKAFPFFIAPLILLAQPHQPDLSPPRTTITGDYGPRNLSGHNWFHKGIDYRGNEGDPISCVDVGIISRIQYYQSGGWNLGIQGGRGFWEYIHIFNDGSNPVYSPDGRVALSCALKENQPIYPCGLDL